MFARRETSQRLPNNYKNLSVKTFQQRNELPKSMAIQTVKLSKLSKEMVFMCCQELYQ